MAENVNARELVLEVLLSVERGEQRMDDAIHAQLLKYQYMSKQERAFVGRLCEGVCEYRIRLDYLLNQVSSTPIHKCKPLIRCLLRMGAYQILFMDFVPDSAACNESVKLAKGHGFSRLSGFVNGVLRNLARQKEHLSYLSFDDTPLQYLSIQYSLPLWLVEQWEAQYGIERTKQMAQASVTKAPLTIRGNIKQILAAQPAENAVETDTDLACHAMHCLEQSLQSEGVELAPIQMNDAMREVVPCDVLLDVQATARYLTKVDYMSRYEAFQNGWFSVQDVSSMLPGVLAVSILRDKLANDSNAGYQVLDMCASPGGKTCHIAACVPSRVKVLARDVSETKVERLQEQIERLGLMNVTTAVCDGTKVVLEDIGAMDIVLLDAPCSGLGVLARKKDICYAMTLEMQHDLECLQRELLCVAADKVKPGGTLLYSTCTVNQGENRDNVEWFLKQHTEYVLEQQIQLLPGVMPVDGFYVASLKKKEE